MRFHYHVIYVYRSCGPVIVTDCVLRDQGSPQRRQRPKLDVSPFTEAVNESITTYIQEIQKIVEERFQTQLLFK